MDFRAIERANQKLNNVSRSAPRKVLSLNSPIVRQSSGAQMIMNDAYLRPSTGIYYSPAITRPMTSDYQNDFFHSVGFSTQNNARLHSRQAERRIPLLTSPMRHSKNSQPANQKPKNAYDFFSSQMNTLDYYLYDQQGRETKFDVVSNLRECLWSRKLEITEENKRDSPRKSIKLKRRLPTETGTEPLEFPRITSKESSNTSPKVLFQVEKKKQETQLDGIPQITETQTSVKQPLRANIISTEDNVSGRGQTEQKEAMNNRFWSSIPSPKREVVLSKTNTNAHVRKSTLEFSTPSFEPGSVKSCSQVKHKSAEQYNLSLNDYVSIVPARIYQKEQNQTSRKTPPRRILTSTHRVKTVDG